MDAPGVGVRAGGVRILLRDGGLHDIFQCVEGRWREGWPVGQCLPCQMALGYRVMTEGGDQAFFGHAGEIRHGETGFGLAFEAPDAAAFFVAFGVIARHFVM